MKKLNSAIIGCGSISSLHIDAIVKSEKTNLYAVCDVDGDKALEVAGKYGCKSFLDYKEMLKDENIDVVHICTPHYLHAPMAIEAMKAGKHVLTEKPMAIATLDAEEMIKVSQSTGKQLGVCFQNRFNTTSQKIKEILDSGKVGKILGGMAFVTWHRDESYYNSGAWRGTWNQEGGGVLINQAIHTLDLLQWFMGDVSKIKATVDTRMLKDVIEVEDTAEATIIFRSGANALFYATNCYCIDAPVRIELVCEKAKIRLEEDLTIKYDNGEIEYFTDADKATGEKAYWGCGHKVLINDFYNKLLDGKDFDIDGKQGIKVVKLFNAIYKSNKVKEFVRIAT
ncbi:MAG TPA: Gfo/Idh/MocA family oxidoreductase [Clostridiaceae bacterium]